MAKQNLKKQAKKARETGDHELARRLERRQEIAAEEANTVGGQPARRASLREVMEKIKEGLS